MKKTLKTGLVLLISTAFILNSFGCFSYAVKTTSKPVQTSEPNKETNMTFAWGLVGASVDATGCTKGLAYSRTQMPWWSFFVSAVTAGIVVPMQSEWKCVD